MKIKYRPVGGTGSGTYLVVLVNLGTAGMVVRTPDGKGWLAVPFARTTVKGTHRTRTKCAEKLAAGMAERLANRPGRRAGGKVPA